MIAAIDVGGCAIGPGHPCFIIAEAGVNHNGDVRLATALIDAAIAARADAVKFQTFHAERTISRHAPKAAYQLATTGATESQLDMVRRLQLPPEAFAELSAYCRSRGIMFLSTAFDEDSADLLDALDVPAFKIASGEVTNLPLVEHIARKGKPVLLSTGMSTLAEVGEAMDAIRRTGNTRVAVLHCVSNYPADPVDANLRAMRTLADAFEAPVGYSDHTLGIDVALAAVALGACVLEKHLTLDTALPGPDHRASLTPQEFAALVRGVRIVESALGSGRKEPAPSERAVAAVARRSLVAARDIEAGVTVTEELIAAKRPGTGLAPAARAQLIGRRAKRDIPGDTLLTWEMFEDANEEVADAGLLERKLRASRQEAGTRRPEAEGESDRAV